MSKRRRSIGKGWASAVIALGAAAQAHGSAAGIRIIVENRSPDQGTWLTPMWVSIHNGTFDTHDMMAPASMELERLAEDGNVGPLRQTFGLSGAGSTDGVVISAMGIPPLAPGESASIDLMIDPSQPNAWYFSYASMVIPSNDAFIGNMDPQAHRIFDEDGNFFGAFIEIGGSMVKDAGTEVNDEVPEHTAFFGQMTPDTGVDENGVVHLHQGFMPAGSGGILDDPDFVNADFLVPGYELARIIIVRTDTVVPPGDVSGTWTLDGSPYLLSGDVSVPAGATLTIEPGVVVFAQSWFDFTVEGTLEALGTEEQPITFTATAPGPGEPGWKGVRFVNAESGHMAWCIVENGQVQSAEPFERGGAIYSLNSSPLIEHCTLRNNHAIKYGGAVYLEGGAPVITDCLIEGNLAGYATTALGGGICSVDADATITSNTIRNNDAGGSGGFGNGHAHGGGMYVNGGQTTISGNVFTDNEVHAEGNIGTTSRGGGLYATGFSTGAVIDRNTFSDNTASGQGAGGGAIYFYSGTYSVVNSIIHDSTGGGIFFDEDATAEVSYGDFHANTVDFAGPAIPAGLGEIVTTNANGDPADAALNIFLNPMFVDAAGGDFNLMAGSPCIDAGNPAATVDPDGTVADLGEFFFDQGGMLPADVNSDGHVDVLDLVQVILTWGECAAPCPPTCPTDVNGDCNVDVQDLVAVIMGWTG